MREEFTIERHGKQYVLYSGLLDAAHEKGLKGIDTELVQVPSEANGNTAICRATVTMEEGRAFSGIGDASPGNVGRAIAPHIIRMAETRAKARALRDAVNVGAASLEELGPDEEETVPRATPGQVTLLRSLAGEAGVDLDAVEAERGPVEGLDAEAAGRWIKTLEARVRARGGAA